MEAANLQIFYTKALAQVHPALYYRTVTVCSYCFRVYSLLDTSRTKICLPANSARATQTPGRSSRPLSRGRTSATDGARPSTATDRSKGPGEEAAFMKR